MPIEFDAIVRVTDIPHRASKATRMTIPFYVKGVKKDMRYHVILEEVAGEEPGTEAT